MNTPISKEIVAEIIKLHSLGKTNRQIGKFLNIHWDTVGNYLRKNNLVSNGCKNQPINLIGNNKAKCSKCGEIKPISEFQRGRKDKQYEYHFSYCNFCRKKQCYLNLNKTIDSFLSDKYNRLKVRAKKYNIPFELEKSYFIKIYHQQKGMCFYTNEKMEWGVGDGHNRLSISVDRVIPKNGYIFGNIVMCTTKANTMKNDLSIDEIKRYLPLFYEKIEEMWRNMGVTCLQVAEGDF